MNEWDITQQLLDIEAAKTDVILQRRLNELGWQHVPEGYVLVPVEPTEKMIEAGFNAHLNSGWIRSYEIYEAMIKAAQEEK